VELNIMIVDDSPVMRTFIRRVIGLTGLKVGDIYEASNGEEALRLLRDHWADLILTDINMPQMNGEELMRHLESDELLRMIPVLVVSTDSTEIRVQRLLALGAKGYLAKPFQPEALRDEVERALGVQDV
jgi:two-component system chemotaxis response regulator CheY